MQREVKKADCFLRGKFRHLTKFSLVGILNTLVDFLVFTALNGIFGAGYLISQIGGYSCGVLNSFIFNKKWTFSDRDSGKKQLLEFCQFLIVNGISLAVTLLAMSYLVGKMGFNLYACKILVTLAAQFTNFVLYKFWIF